MRNALASALQLLRTERGLSQQDLGGKITSQHINLAENGKTSLTTDSLDEICRSLQVHPVAFLALMYAAHEQTSAADVLATAQADLNAMALLNSAINAAPEKKPHPRVAKAAQVTTAVQALKGAGHSRVEIAKVLGLSEPTVRRHWNRPQP
ncbi:helix-turn-helix domain-containing protein [Pseudomonas sp. NFR16]|uniref:helix-turn-helix domain-containing protein n=1 Tax=Pseudomonas sp. NFR16 TaxID=1566248 RepID=UPI0015A52DFA|nr:helix-turn-helix transcriptional regulator [Pseudomonas sp. NFR16]